MSEYILSCCSTADLSKEYFESRNIHYICFHYMLGDKSYPDDLGQSVPFDEFYARMAAGEMTKTSQVNVDEFVAYFEGFLKEGKDILHVSLSSGLSGSVNSARIAAEGVDEDYYKRIVNANFGAALRELNAFESIAVSMAEGRFQGYDPYRFPEIYDDITAEDVRAFLRENFTRAHMALSVIAPKEG